MEQHNRCKTRLNTARTRKNTRHRSWPAAGLRLGGYIFMGKGIRFYYTLKTNCTKNYLSNTKLRGGTNNFGENFCLNAPPPGGYGSASWSGLDCAETHRIIRCLQCFPGRIIRCLQCFPGSQFSFPRRQLCVKGIRFETN